MVVNSPVSHILQFSGHSVEHHQMDLTGLGSWRDFVQCICGNIFVIQLPITSIRDTQKCLINVSCYSMGQNPIHYTLVCASLHRKTIKTHFLCFFTQRLVQIPALSRLLSAHCTVLYNSRQKRQHFCSLSAGVPLKKKVSM